MKAAMILGARILMVGGVALAAPAPPPASKTFSGRGVYYFEGRVPCPLAGVGKRSANASNRVALGDESSRVVVDRAKGRIVVTNTHPYPDRQVIADLTFLGAASTEDGRRVPLAVHVKLEKKKQTVELDVHPHWTVRGALHAPELEAFDIVLDDGQTERTLVGRSDLLRQATENKILYRIEGSLIELHDNLEGKPLPRSLAAGAAVADLSLGFGSKHINKMLLRADLRSIDDANVALAGKPVAELLAKGAWELRLTALSSLLSQETLRRDLFLLGLDRLTVVAAGMKRGLKKGETLTFSFRAGRGRVAWGGQGQDFDDALDVARAFLEFNFLGAVLAQEVVKGATAATPTPQQR
jgi:hypothetical protein